MGVVITPVEPAHVLKFSIYTYIYVLTYIDIYKHTYKIDFMKIYLLSKYVPKSIYRFQSYRR